MAALYLLVRGGSACSLFHGVAPAFEAHARHLASPAKSLVYAVRFLYVGVVRVFVSGCLASMLRYYAVL
jgi:hypothetical protein